MFKFAKTAALSALIGFGAITAMPAQAQATGGAIQFGNGSVTVQFGGGYHDRWERPRRHHRQSCTPGQAVWKAERMGLRNVRVVNANRNVIRVAGRAWRHGRTAIVFARAPNCPVIR